MKKILLNTMLSFFCLSCAFAQVPNRTDYIPFHQTFMEHPENLQKSNGLSRSLVYEQIGMRHDSLTAIDSIWLPVDSIVNYYDKNGNITNSYETVFSNGTWNNYINTEYTLNAAGTADTIITQKKWDEADSIYVSWLRIVNTKSLTGGGDIVNSEIHQSWNASNSTWNNEFQYEKYKDTSGTLVESTYETAGTGSIIWNYVYDTTFLAYIGNNPSSYTVNTDSSGTILNTHKIAISYNKFRLSYLKTDSLANRSGNPIAPFSKSVYTHPGFEGDGQVSLEIDSNWNSSTNVYAPAYEQTYAYDANGNDTTHISSDWRGNFQGWTVDLQNSYVYDNNNNVTYEEDIAPSLFLDSTRYNRYFYYYKTLDTTTGIKEVQNNLAVNVYPNPADNNGSIVSFNLENPAEINMMVYDITGRLALSETSSFNSGANTINIATNQLANGLYTIKLYNRSNGDNSVTELVKE